MPGPRGPPGEGLLGQKVWYLNQRWSPRLSQHTVSSHWGYVNSVEKEWGFGKTPVIHVIHILIFYTSISFSVAYFIIIWDLSSTATWRNIDIRSKIYVFLLPTHFGKSGDYINVKKMRNMGWDQLLDVIISAQKGCTKSHNLLKIKPGGTNSSVCYSKCLFWAKRFLRVTFSLFIPIACLSFFWISLLLFYFSQTQIIMAIMQYLMKQLCLHGLVWDGLMFKLCLLFFPIKMLSQYYKLFKKFTNTNWFK